MRAAWNLMLIPGSLLAAVLLASCDDNGDGCRGGGATAPCPAPISGWASVTGSALTDDATPVAHERVLASCGDVVGGKESPTDAEGRFSIALTYSVADTILNPFPPRQSDGSFLVACQLTLILAGDMIGASDSFYIPFGPTEAGIRHSEVELRLPPEAAPQLES
jgi:hypothetical protein